MLLNKKPLGFCPAEGFLGSFLYERERGKKHLGWPETAQTTAKRAVFDGDVWRMPIWYFLFMFLSYVLL